MEIQRMGNRIPLAGFCIVLLLCNIHLFQGSSPSALIYKTEAVLEGEWWRVFTHLFVHVSWYHLFLDALAVTFLLSELAKTGLKKKIFIVSSCAGSSLICSALFSPYIHFVGYCGLSGLAHGLMFYLGLTWIGQYFSGKEQKRLILLMAGGTLLLLSGGKSVVEVLAGSPFFSHMHFGSIGIPIVHAHLGGVVGALVAFVACRIKESTNH